MTVEPNIEEVNNYVSKLQSEFVNSDNNFWFIGRMTENIDPKLLGPKYQSFQSILELTYNL